MKTLIFATSNQGKATSLTRHLAEAGVTVNVVARPLELIEPQADTALEVAVSKARQAFAMVSQPVVVDDSAFHIAALGGFPGPYIKYMLSTLGVEGIMAFMKGQEDRSAYFESHLVFIDEYGTEHVFSDAPYRGAIAQHVDTYDHPDAWSPLWRIFIPEWTDKTISQLTDTERMEHSRETSDKAAYVKFADWYRTVSE